MAGIPAKRFEVLDRETNVPFKDFLQGGMDSQILNGGPFSNPDVMAMAQEMASSALGDLSTQVASAVGGQGVFEGIQRVIKGVQGTLVDVKSLINGKANAFGTKLDDVLKVISGGNAQIAKALKSVIDGCVNPGTGYGLPGKPYDVSINCGSGIGSPASSDCNVSGMSDLLKSLSGGSYNSGYQNLNETLRKITALAGTSYSMGLCGVFSTLTVGVDEKIKTRAASALLTNLGESGNSRGVFDLASASVGLPVILENPGGVQTFMENFKLPFGTKERQHAAVADQTLGAADIFDENWMTSSEEDMLSISKAGKKSPALEQVFGAKFKNQAFAADDLDTAPDDDTVFALTAYSLMT